MQQYRIRRERLKELNRQLLVKLILFAVVAVVAGFAVTLLQAGKKDNDLKFLPLMLVITFIPLALGAYRSYKKQKEVCETYTLSLTGNAVSMEEMQLPAINIAYKDIAEIARFTNGTYIIYSKETGGILIPEGIENEQQLSMELSRIMPFTERTSYSTLYKYRNAFLAVTFAMFICFYTIGDKFIVTILGAALSCILTWSYYTVQTSKMVPQNLKRKMWLVFLVLASIIARTYFVLSGNNGS